MASPSVKPMADGVMTLRPSQVANVINLMSHTMRVPFIWGPPGISKSAVAQQTATNKGIAFADVRLSQMDPTDLRGMPYRVEEDGVSIGVAWAPPLVLPRDIEISRVIDIRAVETIISFKSMNPLGVNHIHYCVDPVITVESLDDGKTAVIVKQTPDTFVVRLVDDQGKRVGGTVHYTVTGKVKVLVAFEEMNSAPLAVQQAAYQIILDRRVGEYIVPEGVRLMAMGNRQTDKGLTFVMPTPLANRFVHIEMVVNFDDWQDWAAGAMINPMVVGYLINNKGELFNFDPKNISKSFATPRSWEFVSDILGVEGDATETERTAMICGAVGDGIGVKFAAHQKYMAQLPNVNDITSGRIKKLDAAAKDNIAIAYSLTVSTCYEVRIGNDRLLEKGLSTQDKGKERAQWFSDFNNILEFWMENFTPEVCVMGMRIILTVHKINVGSRRDLLPALQEFTKRHGNLIGPATVKR